jgi:hypothetical protein
MTHFNIKVGSFLTSLISKYGEEPDIENIRGILPQDIIDHWKGFTISEKIFIYHVVKHIFGE